MLKSENLLARIDELLGLKYDERRFEVVGEVYAGTIALASQIWGESSAHVQAAKQLREDMQNSKWSPQSQAELSVRQCHGILQAIASDIKGGRLGNLRL